MNPNDNQFRKALLELLEQQIGFEASKDILAPWTEEYRQGYVEGLKQAAACAGEIKPDHDGYFPITSVHRDDLDEAGFDASHVSDDTMIDIAQNLADRYCEYGDFWDSLESTAAEMGIPRKLDDDD